MDKSQIKKKIQKYVNFPDTDSKIKLKEMLDELSEPKAEEYCGKERPARKTLCQLKKGHKGSHRAIIFWED